MLQALSDTAPATPSAAACGRPAADTAGSDRNDSNTDSKVLCADVA